MKLGTAIDIRNMLVGIDAADKQQVIRTMINAWTRPAAFRISKKPWTPFLHANRGWLPA